MRTYEAQGDTLVESDKPAALLAHEARNRGDVVNPSWPTGPVVVVNDDGTVEVRIYGRNDDLTWDADPSAPVVADPVRRMQ